MTEKVIVALDTNYPTEHLFFARTKVGKELEISVHLNNTDLFKGRLFIEE